MAPDLERLARTPWPIACCASSGTRLFQFSLGALVFEKCRVSSSKRAGEFCPGIGSAHIDDADRRYARLRRLDAEQGRALAALDTPPELSLGGDDEMLVKRIRRDLNSNPLAAAGNDRKYRSPSRDNPRLCCSCGAYFSTAASSENDQGSMNLASKTAPVALDPAIERRSHPVQGRVADMSLNI